MANDSLKNIWPEWEVEDKPLGCGSYGVVYKAVRRDHDVVSYAAIKVISIPQSESQIDSIRSEGLSVRDTKTYLEGVVTDFVSEIRLMESFKGVQNIVSVEDYKVVEKEDGIGWDIYIRMELLTPFNKYSADRTLSEQEVIKLGIDMCTALELCAKRNVIHRDIKPENIFINEFGDFKLGDFGIARRLENATSGMSQKGTYPYMAPEVEKSTEYDARADICSLGIVLYRLMNKNRLPFYDLDKQILSPVEREAANRRRLDGEPLPTPCNASQGLSEVILCACAHNPEDRFATATAMKNALLSVANGSYRPSDRTVSILRADQAQNSNKTVSVRRSPESNNANEKSEEEPIATFGQDKQKRTKLSKGKKAGLITVAVLVVIIGLAIAGAITYLGGSAYKAVKSMNRGDYSEAIEMYSDSIKDDFIQSMLFEGLLEKQYNEKLDDYASGRLSYSETLDYIDAVLVFKVIDGADKKFSEIIISRSDAIIEAYKAGTLDYSEAKQELDALAEKEKSVLNTSIANEKVSLLSTLYSAASAYETAEQQMNSGNYVDAITQLDQIPEGSDLYDDAQQKMAEASAAYKTSVLEQANAYVQSENYPGAISVIEYALTILPDDVELQNELGELQTAHHASVVSAALSESTALQSRGDYTGAMRVLSDAMNAVGEDIQLEAAFNTCKASYKSCIISSAGQSASEGDFLSAWSVINDSLSFFDNDEEMVQKAEYYKNEYITNTIARINEYLIAGDFDSASRCLESALAVFPNDTNLQEELEHIEYMKPKLLLDVCPPYELVPHSTVPMWYEQPTIIKMGGISYTNGFVFQWDTCYALYYLGGNYSKLEFDVGHIDGGYLINATINIYLDGRFYMAIEVQPDMLLKHIMLSVDGAIQMKIELTTGSNKIASYGFVNAILTPKENENNQEQSSNPNLVRLLSVCPPYELLPHSTVPMWYEQPTIMKMCGQAFTDGFSFQWDTCYALYNLGGNYSKLEFDLGHIDGGNIQSATIYIYLDGVVAMVIEVTPEMIIRHIEMPLNGATQMKIEMTTGSNKIACYGFANAMLLPNN